MQIQQYSAVNTITIGRKCPHMQVVSSLVAKTFKFLSFLFLFAGGSILLLSAVPIVFKFLKPDTYRRRPLAVESGPGEEEP